MDGQDEDDAATVRLEADPETHQEPSVYRKRKAEFEGRSEADEGGEEEGTVRLLDAEEQLKNGKYYTTAHILNAFDNATLDAILKRRDLSLSEILALDGVRQILIEAVSADKAGRTPFHETTLGQEWLNSLIDTLVDYNKVKLKDRNWKPIYREQDASSPQWSPKEE